MVQMHKVGWMVVVEFQVELMFVDVQEVQEL